MWWRFVWWVISVALTDLLRDSLPSQTPSGVGEFQIPTATEGRVVPIIPGGTCPVRAPNCIWYGDFAAVPKKVTTGVIFKKRETVGFTYEIALAYALLKQQIAGITGIWIGDERVYDGPPASVIDVDKPDMFGGFDSGGGFTARFRLFDGSDTQAASTFMSSRITEGVPAYRGTAYVMITSLDETKGAYIGDTNNLRYITFEVQPFDTVANGGLGDVMGLGNDHHFIGADANPMSVAYELMTSQKWGFKRPLGEVNLDSFKAAAETCWTEGIGFSLLVDEQTTAEAIQDIIEQHVDGYIGPNPVTGQMEVTLARSDYVLANEFQASMGVNVKSVPTWNKGDWSQTYSRVRIRYTDRDKQWKDTHAIAVSQGNRLIQSKPRTKDVRYQSVHTASVANKIAAREIRNLSIASSSGKIELNRSAYQLRPGSVFSFTSERHGEDNSPIRVTKATVGGATQNLIVVDCVADNFDPEVAGVADPPLTDFDPPTQAVVPFVAADQAGFEAPRILMTYDDQPDTVPRIATIARSSGGAPARYEFLRRTRTTFGSGVWSAYESGGDVEDGFAVVGTLRAAQTGWKTANGTFSISVDPITGNLDDLIGVYDPRPDNAGGVAIINPGESNEEWIAFTEIVDDGVGIQLQNVHRAAMDSAMHSHALGDRVWFIWRGGLGMQIETYGAGSGVEVKLLPKSASDAVLEGAATPLDEIEMISPSRITRPLLPIDLDFNGTSFPTGNVDFDTAATGGAGLDLTATVRLWRTDAIMDSVQALNQAGNPIVAADLTGQNLRISVWVYNLDTDPTPVRGDAVASVIDQAVSDQGPVVTLLRSALVSGGITVDFAARIEVEMKHSPPNETADQVSREPLFFDFSAIGTW